MATITITIPDAQMPRVVAALCAYGQWDATKGPQGAFAKSVVMNFIRLTVINTEFQAAQATALAAAPLPADPGLT